MKQYFDNDSLGDAIKFKRVMTLKAGLRDIAKKTKVSPATISRMENGNMADVNNILVMCGWLGKPITEFIKTKK